MLGRLERVRSDCVLSGVYVPEIDGLTFCKRLAERTPGVACVRFPAATVGFALEPATATIPANDGVADRYEEPARGIRGRVGTRRATA